MLTTVSDKGQLTLPKKLRTQMGITPGTRLALSLGADGTLAVRVQARGADLLFGLLAVPGEAPKTLAHMDDAISAAVSDRAGARP